jgi:hypothetical protein
MHIDWRLASFSHLDLREEKFKIESVQSCHFALPLVV